MFTVSSSEYSVLDDTRREVSRKLDPARRTALGQFMTPNAVASFMASLFTYTPEIKLLDPGAGIGSLTSAFLEVALRNNATVELETWEIDSSLRPYLLNTLDFWKVKSKNTITATVHPTDFIEDACFSLAMGGNSNFTHAIINPPYKKINSNSKYRHLLSEIGIETVNLYSAFVALSIRLLSNKGQLVAIIPRSFCNGTYYLPFREYLLNNTTIRQIHLFKSRSKAFKDDDVLQENLVLFLTKDSTPKKVIVSTSHGSDFLDYVENEYEYSSIVDVNSNVKYIHIPSSQTDIQAPSICTHSLSDIGLEVSTGPVVDFRAKPYLRKDTNKKSVPLIYPHNFVNGKLLWPKEHKKPNALKLSPSIKKLLMPRGHYVLVKRFSSKEEKRRLVAYYVSPADLKADLVGFENHLNVYHHRKEGIDELLARGLAVFLNLKIIDDHFRVFSGHTQVNATDLRTIRYPSREKLIELGSQSLEINPEETAVENLTTEIQAQ
jgi:adenine-specific DNA-methyltransferase